MSLKKISFSMVVSIFQQVRSNLLENWHEFARIHSEKMLGEGISSVLEADLWAEQQLVPMLREFWPGIPFLCEEAERSELAAIAPGIELLPYHFSVDNLPEDYASLDGVDGSALYANQCFELVAMMAGCIRNGIPSAGIVMNLDDCSIYHTGMNGRQGVFRNDRPHQDWFVPKRPLDQCLIATDDNKAVSEDFRNLVINKLTSGKGTRYPINCPSGMGPINVLRGRAAAYVTSNAHNWDLVANAALLDAAGMVVRCLDGTPVPWNRVRMPPVVFARDEETFEYVSGKAGEYLELQKHIFHAY